MVKFILKILVPLILIILAYNYFQGTREEKAQTEEIVGKAKDLGVATWELLKSEKEKFDQGKYDGAIENVKELLSDLQDKAAELDDKDALRELDQLEKERDQLEKEMKRQGENGQADKKLEKAWDDLLNKTENVMRDIEQ